MVKYEIIRESIDSKNSGTYISYGICATDENYKEKISDISVSEENVKNLVLLLNRNHVSKEHFFDVVSDFVQINI